MQSLWTRLERIPPTIVIFLFFFSIYAFTMSGVIQYGDEIEKYRVAQSIVERQEFSFRPTAQRHEIGRGGQTYSIYELGQTVLQVPLYGLAKLANSFFAQPDINRLGFLIVGFLNPLLTALTCVVLFQTCRALGFRFRTCLALTLAFGLATIAWPYSKGFTREPLVSLLLLFSFYAALRFGQTKRIGWILVTGVAAGYLTFTKLIQGTAIPILLVYILVLVSRECKCAGMSNRQTIEAILKRGALFLLPSFILMTLQSLYALARFENPVSGIGGTRYNPADWILLLLPMSEPSVATLGLLFSPDKSVFLYSLPTLLFLVAWFNWFQSEPRVALVLLALVLAAFGTNISRPDWDSGTWWGPRYLVQIIPLLIIPIGALESVEGKARRAWKMALLFLFAGGFLVSAIGAFGNERNYLDVMGRGTTLTGQIDFLRHGAIDSLVLYVSPVGELLQINPYGLVLLAIVALSSLWILREFRLRILDVPRSARLGQGVLALALLVQSSALIVWVVAPYSQVLAKKADTLFVAGDLFLADDRICEATAMYLMALKHGTTYQREALARVEELLPRARGAPLPMSHMIAETEMPDAVVVEEDHHVTISGEGALKISASDLGNIIARIQAEPFSVLPNTTYELSGWVRAENVYGAGYASLTVSEDDGTLHHIRSTDIFLWDETSGWIRFQKTFTTLPTTRRLFVATWLWRTSGTIWVDGLQIAHITAENPPSVSFKACRRPALTAPSSPYP